MAVILPTPFVGDTSLPHSVDVAVIGGGIVGVSTALFLAERGVSVAVFEKGRIAGEQSGRNWGWVRQMGREVAEIPLAMHSLSLWETMNARTGRETGFRQTGITYLCRGRSDLVEYEAWLDAVRAFQLPSRLVSGSDLTGLLRGMTGSFVAGLHTANDGRAEPSLAAPAMAEAARGAGASILTQCAVRGIETAAGAISGVVTEKGTVRCTSVVLAGGAWSRLFAGSIGIDFPQLKILGTVARVGPVDGVPDMPVGADNFSFRRRVDGGFSVAMRNANIAPITPDSFRLFADFVPTLVKQWHELKLRVGHRFVEEWRTPRSWALDAVSPFEKVRILDPVPFEKFNRQGLAHLVKAFPAFGAARITDSWSGLIDVTPDAVPVIDRVEAIPGFFIASGFSGHGFGIGPGAGQLMADIVTGDTPKVDPHPFRLGRFQRAVAKRARRALIKESEV